MCAARRPASISPREVTVIYTTHEVMPEQTAAVVSYKEVTATYTRHKILLEQAMTVFIAEK